LREVSEVKVEIPEMQQHASGRQSSLALALLLLSLAGCSADNSHITSRQKTEFEGSQFCKKHACRADEERALDRGGLSRAYRIRDDDSVLIKLETWGSDLFTASIGLYGQEELRSDFQELATEFFASTIPDCRLSRALHSDLTRRLSAIMEARPHLCGPWEVRAGRVLSAYIMTAER
jgi:hypothetical protein